MKQSLFHILNGYAHICLPTETCHGPWNSLIFSVTIAGFPVLDSAIGNGFLHASVGFQQIIHTSHAEILYAIIQSIGLSRFVYVGVIFSTVTTCRGFHLTDRLAKKLALLHLRLFLGPFSSHTMECSGIVGEGTSVCRFKSVPTSVIADQFVHAWQTHVASQSILCCFRCLAVNSVWDWSRI